MRILMTQRELQFWAGSELVTVEVARELRARGHDVAVFSPRIGRVANLLTPSGIWVRSKLSELPWEPEIIHGHHHLQAVAALSYFTEAPAIYYCHGVFPWPEHPPIHPRILRYLVMCEWMAPRLDPEIGVSVDRVAVVPNFVNTRRFSQVRKAPDTPARALVFGGSGFDPVELQYLEAICAQRGISLDRIGYAYDNHQEYPERFLQAYDLVFAIGKCAIEAMACGCAVIPLVPGLAGHLITPDNYAGWSFSNFSPRYFTAGTTLSAEWLDGELKQYAACKVAAVTEKLRTTRSLAATVDRLETIYEAAIAEHRSGVRPRAAREFSDYLEKLALEADTHWLLSEELERSRTQLGTFARREASYLDTIAKMTELSDKLSVSSEERLAVEAHIRKLQAGIVELQKSNDELRAELVAAHSQVVENRGLRGMLRRLLQKPVGPVA